MNGGQDPPAPPACQDRFARPAMPGRLLAVLLLAVLSGRAPGQPFLEHLEPPVLEVGKTTRLTCVGSGLDRARDLWASLPAGSVRVRAVPESRADRAVLE